MLKIKFCDFWPGLESNNLFIDVLKRNFDVALDDNPDYLFFSVYGNDHLKYNNCVKIFFSGENIVPDFNLCDYAMGFHYIEFEDRYMRFPLYVYYYWHHHIVTPNLKLLDDNRIWDTSLSERKFCNFIYSNNVNADPFRDLFFKELSKYKKVDSGGRHLNNMGHGVDDKMDFIKEYKFTIAFENSSTSGYTSEKLLEPLLMNSLPIYYGNPTVKDDFNSNAFVHVGGVGDLSRAIKEIIYLDNNDQAYQAKLKQPYFNEHLTFNDWENRFVEFMNYILKQPISQAKRRVSYGFERHYVDDLKAKSAALLKRNKRNEIKLRIKKLLNSIYK